MEFRDYVRILRRRGWIIILLAVMTAAAAFAFSKLQTPIYKSSVDILVQPARADWGLAQAAKILLRSYVSWMDTETHAQEVIDVLNLDRLPGDLRSDVTIASDDSRLVIQVTVEDPIGDSANDIAKAYSDLFIQWRNAENAKQRKEDRVEAIQLDPPRYALARPKWKINTLAGSIFGALVGGVIVFVLEWIESGVVRRPQDVERYLGVPVLGAIAGARLEGGRPPLPREWVSPEAVRAAPPPAHWPPEAALQTEEEAAPDTAAEADLPPDEDQVGPVDPTILHSKGDY